MRKYWYDALKRRISTRVNGISQTNLYDPVGNELVSWRVADGVTLLVRSNVYNAAGELTASYDALGVPTLYTNYLVGGLRVRQTTYADASTRVETFYPDGQLQSVSGTAVHGHREYYEVVTGSDGVSRLRRQTVLLSPAGQDTAEVTTQERDFAGRDWRVLDAAGLEVSRSEYNAKGQLAARIQGPAVTNLYAYNGLGELALEAVDMDANGQITTNSLDRLVLHTRGYGTREGYTTQWSKTHVWTNDTDASMVEASYSESTLAVTNARAWQRRYGRESRVETTWVETGVKDVKRYTPDGQWVTERLMQGRTVGRTNYDNGNPAAVVSWETMDYDNFGRLSTHTVSSSGKITSTVSLFDAADRAYQVTQTGDGPLPQVTQFFFNFQGQQTNVVLPDNGVVSVEYCPTGEQKETHGTRTYPVRYAYDHAGRMTNLTTWQTYPTAGAAITSWSYDSRGKLSRKSYADGQGVLYAYDNAGRLQTRTWARGTNATYAYTPAGELQSITYNDGSSAIYFGYDRLGRQTTAMNQGVTTTRDYTQDGGLYNEYQAGGLLDTMQLRRRYHENGALSQVAVRKLNTAITVSSTFGYDSAARLAQATNGTSIMTYQYLANGPLAQHIVFTTAGTEKMRTTRTYDGFRRLERITNSPLTGLSHQYGYNAANQRTNAVLGDGLEWRYGYDSLGQVTSGRKYLPDGQPLAGEQFEYLFDDIGNRRQAGSGGNAWGGALRYQTYTANSLNQYTSRTVPGSLEVTGSAAATATVTANGQTASRQGEHYRLELGVTNVSAAVWQGVTNLAVGVDGNGADLVAGQTSWVYVAQSPEAFAYDLDGNLTNDGRWSYSWDAENRLTGMETRLAVTNSGVPRQKLRLQYDWMGRRISKTVSNYTGSAWSLGTDHRFIYDGWNLAAILAADLSPLVSFTWGNDLSGSRQGAGGVGGLLATVIHQGANAGTYCPAYDGNGNITAYVRASDGVVVAQYEYGPFGELIRATGPMAKEFPFLLSSKFYDWETGLYYYGYRYYDPITGRWLARDPLDENGGINLYGFVNNSAPNCHDPDGRIMGFVIGVGVDLVVQISANVVTGKDWYDINVSSVIIAGAVGIIAPGVGTIFKGVNNAGKLSTVISKTRGKLCLRKNPTRIDRLNRRLQQQVAALNQQVSTVARDVAVAAAWQLTKRNVKKLADKIEQEVINMDGSPNDGYSLKAEETSTERGAVELLEWNPFRYDYGSYYEYNGVPSEITIQR